MKINYFEILNNIQVPIKLDLRLLDYKEKKPLNIILHGFKAYRNWGFIPYFAERFTKDIGPTINFDFSLNGIDNEKEMLYNVDLFRTNTVSQQLKDIEILLNEINDSNSEINKLLSPIWNGKVNLIGHSLGGACSLISAESFSQISSVVLLGSISKTDRNTERQKREWREKGFIEFKESYSGQILYLDVEYLEDKERNKDKIDLRRIISKLEVAICVIHGKLDFTVPLKEAEILIERAKNSKILEYLFIDKCNHTFGVSHQFNETNTSLELTIDKIKSFLN
jgi:hypothetical protein